jgi:hypothetical protein
MRGMRRLSFALLLVPVSAAAHIHLTAPQSRIDTLAGQDQKEQHCGVLNQARTTRVTTFKPGETITVTWMETINHPGWFRISFQPNGDVFRIPPASNGDAVNNMGQTVASNMPTEDRTGMTDETGAIVLKDRIADGTLSTTVTLPDMECNNCTLQFIQVMIDKMPYTTDAASDDIYFNCADITLSAGAAMPDAGGGGVDQDASNGGNNNASTSGGCSTTGGAGLAIGLALLTLRRRRDRSPA